MKSLSPLLLLPIRPPSSLEGKEEYQVSFILVSFISLLFTLLSFLLFFCVSVYIIGLLRCLWLGLFPFPTIFFYRLWQVVFPRTYVCECPFGLGNCGAAIRADLAQSDWRWNGRGFFSSSVGLWWIKVEISPTIIDQHSYEKRDCCYRLPAEIRESSYYSTWIYIGGHLESERKFPTLSMQGY